MVGYLTIAGVKGVRAQLVPLFSLCLVVIITTLYSVRSYAAVGNDLELMLKSLPTTAASVPAAQRGSMVLRTAGSLIRVTPAGVAGTGLVTLAMMYADSSGDDVAEYLFGNEQPSTVPEGWTDANTPPAGGYPEGYTQGTRWVVFNSRWTDPGGACYYSVTGSYGSQALHKIEPHPTNPSLYECYWKTDANDQTWSFQGNASPEQCGPEETTGPCQVLTPASTATEWPEDGLLTYVQEGGKWVPHQYENSADISTFSMPENWYWVDPDTSSGFGQSHYDGSQTITEYMQGTNAAGDIETRSQTVKVAPDGTITSVNENLFPGLTVEQAMAKTATPDLKVAIDVPDDYAREDTLTELKDFLKEDIGDPPTEQETNYDGNGFDLLDNAMGTVADPPELSGIPDLPGYSSTCQTLGFTLLGNQFVFPNTQQCSRLGDLKTMLGWFLYMLTAFLIFNVVMREKVK